jgi:hypothetical protein
MDRDVTAAMVRGGGAVVKMAHRLSTVRAPFPTVTSTRGFGRELDPRDQSSNVSLLNTSRRDLPSRFAGAV